MACKFIAPVAFGLMASACSYSHTTAQVPAPVPIAVAPVPAPVTATYVAPEPVATTTVYTPAVPDPAPSPPVGVQAFRDEYGFRYDALGNRIDRYGNIVSPQSTIP